MLYILTIHYKDKWVDIQKRELQKYLNEDYKVFTRLGENFEEHKDKFDGVIEGQGHWTESMGLLLKLIKKEVKSDDKILLIDSDAFPISNQISYFFEAALNEFEFVSCQEPKHEWDDEYKIPHPMFMLFRAKHILNNNLDEYLSNIHIDLSGNWWGGAIHWIIKNKYSYFAMKRSNKINLHPLYFGVYNNLIYHHWAGSRKMITRRDRLANNKSIYLKVSDRKRLKYFKVKHKEKSYLMVEIGGTKKNTSTAVIEYCKAYGVLDLFEKSSFKLKKDETYSINELENGLLITIENYDEADLDKTAEENHKMSNDIFEQIKYQPETIMNFLTGQYDGEVE